MHYYKRIKELRNQHNKTQKEVAEKLGMKQPHYVRYEKGDRDTPTEKLMILADYYGVSTDYLLGRTDIKKPYPPSKE